MANRGTKEYTKLKKKMEALAPEFTGKVRTYFTSKTKVLNQFMCFTGLASLGCDGLYLFNHKSNNDLMYNESVGVPVLVRADKWSTEVQRQITGLLRPQVAGPPTSRHL